ncbi:zinc-binding dehydrogenase [Halopseudomonas maritima]|uniref:zinc-binding dehydrogenase n=1 Tax=Halopseudomonas maritima TaxID=2918528 RepID=UPI001EEA64F0|nr:zinc-binding dehydrogenase [Halopseudomonas maritima]UJJ30248.1 zinc-binding dehydrogenase [Halopseudomonas maritima]
MKAVVMRDRSLQVEQLDAPVPGAGEVLVKTLACGICGSDLHMFHHCGNVLSAFATAKIPVSFDPKPGVVFGHEYCAEILDHGPGASKQLKVGTRVVSLPFVVGADRFDHIGFSNRYPGGYGEQMVLAEQMLIPVPGDLPSDVAALTEPLAVAMHAVNRAQLTGDEVPVVVGCGPIGLAVIAILKAKGIGPVVASDFSSARRQLAEQLGADVVVNPAEQSPWSSWLQVAAPTDFDIDGPMALLGIGPQPRPCVVFECVGVPGVMQQIIQHAPPRSRVMIVGMCMERDSFEPLMALPKEVSIQFTFGYSTEEFGSTLHALADGKLNAQPMITRHIGLEQVPAAFDSLAQPEDQAKIMIVVN